MRLKTLWAALMVAGLAAACGGDGGGDSSTPGDTTSTTVNLAGIAAKGVLSGALVSVHPIKADGQPDLTKTLASVETGADGKYTLPAFTGTRGAVYLVRITAIANKTTALDEITGTAVPLPADFVMRGLFVAPSAPTTSATSNVTPFSELAAAAAVNATGGASAGNAEQALANVRSLLGFDPTTVTPATIQAAATGNEQTLAVMLTAVAKLANDSALGCTSTDLGQRTKCVVDQLAASAKLDSTKPGTVGTTDVAAALVGAAEDVVADPDLTKDSTVNAGTINTVKSGLEGDGTVVPPNTANGIAATKALFQELRSDLTTLFSNDGVTSVSAGAVNQEAFKFSEALKSVQDPVEMLAKDVGAVIVGIDLYNDFKAGRSGNSRNGGEGEVANGDANTPSLSCSLYTTSATNELAQVAADANFIGCSTVYYVTRVPGGAGQPVVQTRWRHGFTITPGANNTFTYEGRARKRVENCQNGTCTLVSNEALQTNGVTGNLTTTLTDGHITGFTIKGDLAGGFKSGTTQLANVKTTVDLTGTRTIGADNLSSTTFSGTSVTYGENNAVLGTLTVKSGATSEVAVSWDANGNLVARDPALEPAGGDLATASLNIVWATAAAEFEGEIALTDSVWDKSKTSHVPSKAKLRGVLSTVSNGTKAEFFNGTLTASTTGYAAYDETKNDSATNNFGINLAFTGSVTAPGRPKLEVALDATTASHLDDPTSATVSYKSIVNGQAKMQVGVTATATANGP
ncbi:MAG: hypothetical protein ABW067_10540, partial [Rhizobacter sp.]